MHSFIVQQLQTHITHRYITFVISVCCVLCGYAQQTIPQRVCNIIESKDIKECKTLMQEIKDSDVENMQDSTLFDYYYLAGWYNWEIKDYEQVISFLVKAKETCETKLGIENNAIKYFEILKALGEACEELNKEDDALLWYEEGIVKGALYIFHADDASLQSYFSTIITNLANIYESRGAFDIANYLRQLRNEKPLDYEGTYDYACDLIEKAVQLYNEEKSSEAITLLNEAKEIFKKTGDEGVGMLQPLYRLSLKCYAHMGDKKSVDALLRSKKRIMYHNDTESYFISDMHEVIAAYILNHHDIKTAEYYYQKLQKEVTRSYPADLQKLEKIGQQMEVYQRKYAEIDSLENVRKEFPLYSYEWGIASFLQSNILISLERYDEAIQLCKQIYEMSVNLKDDPQNLHWFVLMNISDYYNKNRDLNNAERYLKEQLTWLDSKNIPYDDENRGLVYNKLGIAYLYGKRYEDGRKVLDKAESILVPIYGYKSYEYATILHNKGRLAQLEGNLDVAKQYLENAADIQMELGGEVSENTKLYLEEVNHAIDVRL